MLWGKMFVHATIFVERAMHASTTYGDWLDAATLLDQVKGHHRWRHDPQSRMYDNVGLQARLDELRKARYTNDWDTRLRLLVFWPVYYSGSY